MGICGGGGQAEQVVVPESALLTVPDSVDLVPAGGFPEVFCTAQDALFSQADLCEDDTVLISGAAGGVGTAAVQLAAVAGARVVATVRNPDHHDRVRALGADDVILPDEVGEHGPYDVSLELVGASGVEAVLPHLAKGARVVVIGVGAGARAQVNLLALMGCPGHHRWVNPPGADHRGEGRGDLVGRESVPSTCWEPAPSPCRCPPPSPCRRLRPPMSGSRRAASWARSSW